MYRKGDDVRNIDLIYSGTERPIADDCEGVRTVSQRPWKPEGGLWTSPVAPSSNGRSVWQVWCEKENYNTQYYQKHWHIVPHEDCNVLVVDEDLENVKEYMLSVENDPYSKGLDYEKIAEKYDAVYFPQNVVWSHNYDYLRSFDVESCLFLRGKYDVMDDNEYKTYCRDKQRKEFENSTARYRWEMENPRYAMLMEIRARERAIFQQKAEANRVSENSSKVEEGKNVDITNNEIMPMKKELEKEGENKVTTIEKTELSEKEKKKRAMLRRIAKLNVSKEKGVVNPKRSNLEKAYLVMIDKLKNR